MNVKLTALFLAVLFNVYSETTYNYKIFGENLHREVVDEYFLVPSFSSCNLIQACKKKIHHYNPRIKRKALSDTIFLKFIFSFRQLYEFSILLV